MKFAFLTLLAIASIGLAACDDTWQGIGEDTEDVGEEIQSSSGNR